MILILAFVLLVAFAGVGLFEAGISLCAWLEGRFSAGVAWGAFITVLAVLMLSAMVVAAALIDPLL